MLLWSPHPSRSRQEDLAKEGAELAYCALDSLDDAPYDASVEQFAASCNGGLRFLRPEEVADRWEEDIARGGVHNEVRDREL